MGIDRLDWGQKLAYCLETMWLVYDLNDLITASDYACRLLARSAFMYLDSFLQLADQRDAELHGPATDALRSLRLRYRQRKPLRDRLGAHRQEMDYFVALVLVAGVDDVTLETFIRDAEAINDAFRQQDDQLAAVHRVPVPPSFATTLTGAIMDGQISAAPSPLEAISDNAFGVFFTTDVQWKAATLVSIKRTIDLVDRLVRLIPHLPAMERLVKSILVTEAVSFLDNLYHDESPARERSFAELAKDAHLPISGRLQPLTVPIAAVDQIRLARRKIAAHVDVAMSFEDLMALLDDITPADVHTVFDPAFDAFYECAYAWPPTRAPLATLQPVRGAVAVAKADPVEPYHRV